MTDQLLHSERASVSVAVIITTRGRPELARALASVATQTLPVAEIIIVDDQSGEAVVALADVPVGARVVRTGGVGANAARNRGVEEATSLVVAFLDDDDVWFPSKIERQLGVLLESGMLGRANVLVGCQTLVEQTGRVQPRYPYERGSVAEWLFCPSLSTLRGDACLQTSSLMVERAAFKRTRFDETLESHQDWDWALRFLNDSSGELRLVAEPLYEYTSSAAGKKSYVPRLRAEQEWALRVLPRRSKELFGYFYTTGIGRALQANDLRMAIRAASRGFRYGRPHAPSLIAGAIACLANIRRMARSAFGPSTPRTSR